MIGMLQREEWNHEKSWFHEPINCIVDREEEHLRREAIMFVLGAMPHPASETEWNANKRRLQKMPYQELIEEMREWDDSHRIP